MSFYFSVDSRDTEIVALVYIRNANVWSDSVSG